MTEQDLPDRAVRRRGGRRRPKPSLIKRMGRRFSRGLANSSVGREVVALAIAGVIRLIFRSNRLVKNKPDPADILRDDNRVIYALWHGQHLMSPMVNPPGNRLVALFSRSADAELNARVAEWLGLETVRGSGGRPGQTDVSKGGARALIALKKTLDAGTSVAMIADIPNGRPRQAGMGIVTLAKISGRPVRALALATSRRKVIEKSWDKTTINLPFGKVAITFGELISVPSDASGAELEAKRREITDSLNATTEKAYALVDGRP